MANRLNAFGILDELVSDLLQGRRLKRERRDSMAVAGQLAAWAAQSGFEILDPLDLEVCDRSSDAFELCMETTPREVGTALRRRHARGALYLFDSFCSYGDGPRSATGLVTTDATLHELTSQDGLAGLPKHSVMQRSLDGRIAVHVPVPLDQHLAEILAGRC